MQSRKEAARNDTGYVKRFIRKYLKMIIVSVIIILLLTFDLSPFGGSIRFYSKWIACGQKPVEIAAAPAESPWYQEPQIFEPIRIFTGIDYYCTTAEAEAAGYEPRRP